MKEDSTWPFNLNRAAEMERKTEGKIEARKETMKESLPVLPSKPVELPIRRKKYTSLPSVGVPSKAVDVREDKGGVCYNCGKKGHSFVDCLVKCGHCDLDGHKTMYCKLVHPRAKLAVKRA